jgi:sugar O-acyltransferase (sialic acid O-acetyltransferase NeuD family)
MIFILGGGGHGQVVADIFRARCRAGLTRTTTAFLDDDPRRHGALQAGSRVLGPTALLATEPHDGVVVAIGDNRTRAQLFARVTASGEVAAVAEHPRSIVAEDVVVGPGSMICAGAVISTGSIIGANTIVNTGATVDHHASIGDHVHIAPGVHLGGEVRVGEGALIGIGAVVLPRVSVGAWSTVGAGAVVTSDVPPGVTVAGVPARPLAVPQTV